ncbi:MAG: hypothetical protein Q4A41_06600, partial [Bacillota bacterium]|nr:hypothetical protein [Bacillota bacterium]
MKKGLLHRKDPDQDIESIKKFLSKSCITDGRCNSLFNDGESIHALSEICSQIPRSSLADVRRHFSDHSKYA